MEVCFRLYILAFYLFQNFGSESLVHRHRLGHLVFRSYNNNTFDDIYHVSLVDCIAYCIQQAPRCVGVNYARTRQQCFLCKLSLEGYNGVIMDERFVYSPRKTWDQDILNGYTLPICDEGWQFYMDSCFKFDLSWKGNWDEAKIACQSLSAQLVEIRSEEKQNFLFEMVFMTDNTTDRDISIWTGGSDLAQEGVFRWDSDNVTFNSGFTNWLQYPYQQPDNWHYNQGLSQDCVLAKYVYPGGGGWDDALCEKFLYGRLMCEKAAH